MKKIIVVYHAYMTGNKYMAMIIEQVRRVLDAQIYGASSKIYIGVVQAEDMSPKNGSDWIRSVFSFTSGSAPDRTDHKRLQVEIYNDNKEEARTLQWIKEYSKDNPGDYVLYFHTKGITHYTEATESWRRYMEYFVIDRWRDCIQKLDEGFDACGVLWNRDTVYGDYPHFSGGMWWANTDYINTLDHDMLTMEWRYGREFWIGSNPNAKVFEFHNSRMNDKEKFAIAGSHYSIPYHPGNYTQSISLLDQMNIEAGSYLSDKGVIHSYLPFYTKLFIPYMMKSINLFEVGFQYGGSCRLWEKFFPSASIRAIDISMERPHRAAAEALGISTHIQCGERVRMEVKDIKELTPEYFKDFPVDIAIDDGSHTLEDQLFFVRLMQQVVIKGGLIIVEDVQDIDNQYDEFKKLGYPFSVVDLRDKKGVYDDVIIIYNK